MVRMSDKQLAGVLGIHPRKVCQAVPPAADKMARIAVADAATYHAIMADAIARVTAESRADAAGCAIIQ